MTQNKESAYSDWLPFNLSWSIISTLSTLSSLHFKSILCRRFLLSFCRERIENTHLFLHMLILLNCVYLHTEIKYIFFFISVTWKCFLTFMFPKKKKKKKMCVFCYSCTAWVHYWDKCTAYECGSPTDTPTAPNIPAPSCPAKQNKSIMLKTHTEKAMSTLGLI